MSPEGTELDVRVEDRLQDRNGRPVVVLVLGGCSLDHATIAALAAKCIDQVAVDYPSPEPVTVVAARGDELEDFDDLVEAVRIGADVTIGTEYHNREHDPRRVLTIDHRAAMDAMAGAFVHGCKVEPLEPIERPWADRAVRRKIYGRQEAHRLPRQLGGKNKSHGRGRWR